MSRLLPLALAGLMFPTSLLAQDRPNIVLILMDNLGFGELGSYGGGELRGGATERLDALAEEGLRLLN